LKMNYVIDTYAWVEYFRGTDKGKKLQELLDQDHTFITPICCIFELRSWALSGNLDFIRILNVVRSISGIESLKDADWEEAAVVRHKHRKTIKDFGLVDALIVVVQQNRHAKVISGDRHFKTLKNVVYIGDNEN
jgi:predicted nucleic acid-binding protein